MEVSYYAEARADGVAAFHPAKCEFAPASYRVEVKRSGGSRLVINEVVTANVSSASDPQGDADDWIEIYNSGDEEIDLSGYYLSDKELN